ncbi:MAG: hypothetical protein KDD25_03780, partial [Bdellovibrionales bacterium]|nr:hypothetical protein [Bdellovibrionales bacterium]
MQNTNFKWKWFGIIAILIALNLYLTSFAQAQDSQQIFKWSIPSDYEVAFDRANSQTNGINREVTNPWETVTDSRKNELGWASDAQPYGGKPPVRPWNLPFREFSEVVFGEPRFNGPYVDSLRRSGNVAFAHLPLDYEYPISYPKITSESVE